jgi:anthranilate synthase/aminodeoxychorismate synthase-like glutamine amidotransferase
MPKILLIDNYDSFTYNVIQAFLVLGAEISIFPNDEKDLPNPLDYDALIISPGPDHPSKSGISIPLIHQTHGKRPILGICLGHQAIACAFGGFVGESRQVVHGEAFWITHSKTGLFTGLPTPFSVGRYHSLSIHTLPNGFFADAHTTDGTIMSIRHHKHPTFGLQFHPESILTPMGMHLFENFFNTIST